MLETSVSDPSVPGYRILSRLGVGGMASVYLAVQESLDRKVALKIMAPELAAEEGFAGRFLKEGRITGQLSHPNLVTVFDIGQHGSTYYLAAEFIPGGSLRDRLEQGITVAESLDVVCDIAQGLQFAHDAGVVHRDVKPGNVLFRLNGAGVLADFGIAKSMDGRTMVTQIGSAIGTPHYMSPEQTRGESVDGRSDLYSLGVMLFELLTGRLPYHGDTPLAIALMQLNAPLPQLPPALAWLQPLIDGLMAKDCTTRLASGDAVLAEVERLLAQAPDRVALRNARETRERVAPRLPLADGAQRAAPSTAASAAQSGSSRGPNEPASANPRVTRPRMVVAAIAVLLTVLAGAAAWRAVSTDAGVEAARIDQVCRAAAASVNTALDAADLTHAQARFAAMPIRCEGRDQVKHTRDALLAAAERAAAARSLVQASIDRNDLREARYALDTLTRIDRFATDLPELRNRLDQAQYGRADDHKASAGRGPVPIEHGRPAAPPASQPHPDGVVALERAGANTSGQQSRKCRDISLRAGLGEETVEERRYLSENCR